MEEIVLKQISKIDNVISYDFSVSEGLAGYFSGKPFVIEYPENIESVPDAVAAVPFICNVLPIIWLTDSVLRVKELDKAFYECIPNVRRGYETMFPESAFAGKVAVDRIVPYDKPSKGGSAAFFSGGLDAMQTLVSHLEQKPALISIWGSDIRYENKEGWEIVHRGIQEAVQKFDLPDVAIHSSFRDFDNEGALHRQFREQLKDGWWHGVKHGIGLLGHAAPYAYLKGLSTVYIASSNCPTDGPVRCTSNPLTDNQVRFVGARVVHDGFEFSRQDKVHNVVEYVQKTGNQVSLHVCWESQSGGNCCHCEKCYRTMTGLLAEGADPVEYGFQDAKESLADMHRYIVSQCTDMQTLPDYWPHIQRRICENKQLLQSKPYWKQIKWMVSADFMHPETLKMPLSYRIRSKLSTFQFYQMLHNLKVKLHG